MRGGGIMAEKAAASPHPAPTASANPCRLASDAAVAAWTACPSEPAAVGAVAAVAPRHARTVSGEMGKPSARVRRTGKRSDTHERAQVRRRRDCRQSGRRFGDILSAGNSNYVGSPDYGADYGLSHMDSFQDSLSSSDKENVKPRRKRILDDALFEFFRKEAIKSLKTDFAYFCNDSDIFSKNKRLKVHLIGRDSFTSYSIKYFCEVLKSLTVRRKEVIRKFGFGCLLLLEKCEIPSTFVRWISSCVDPVSHQIIVDDSKVISISKDSVHYVIGLPNSGHVPMPDSEGGAKFILSLFGLAELPHITFFGKKLMSQEVLTDKEVFVCFMVIAFKCFLFPTIDEYPNTDFLSILKEPEYASGVDLSFLVFEHLISGVYKYSKICKLNGRKPKHFEFCYYIPVVYYLDSLDFGSRIIDQSVPRISVWKGNLIKFFSDLDYKKNNLFGKRHLKKNLPSCYNEAGLQEISKSANDASNICLESSSFSMVFKNNLHLRFGSTLQGKIVDGIIESIQSALTAKHPDVSKHEMCVTNVLEFLMELKSPEVNVPSSETNIFGTGIRNCEPVRPSPEAKSDVASKLGLINQHEFLRKVSSTASGNKLVDIAESPECLMNKAVEHCNVSTAPAMQPLRKVKSRLPHPVPDDQLLLSSKTYPADVKNSRSFLNLDSNNGNNDAHQSLSFGGFVVENNITSPISRINFSQSLVEKDVSAFLVSKGCTFKKQRSTSSSITGSMGAPIPVVETSPQPTNKSPEVQIIGSNFRLRQIELAKKSDELYNRLINNAGQQDIQKPAPKSKTVESNDNYVDLSQHAAEECLQKNTLVILQPINRLALPLQQNHRFPVSNLDVKNFCAIVELAYTEGVQKSASVKFDKVHCSFISLGQSLQREGHVDNFLIPVFCRKLFEDNHPSKSGRHHFFSFIGENILDYNNDVQLGLIAKAFKGAASASKGKKLEQSDRLFFPICRSRHWFTFCVDFKFKLFIFLDSLFNKEDDFHTSIKNVLINNFVKLWKKIFETEENIFRNYSVMYPNVPKQDNADDCGPFTMKFMEIFKPEVDTCKIFSKEDIVHIRIQYANQLFFCKRNTVDKSVVVNFKMQA